MKKNIVLVILFFNILFFTHNALWYNLKDNFSYIKELFLKTDIYKDYIKFTNFSAIWDKSIFLKTKIENKLQEKNLSCELNTASLFVNYFSSKKYSEDDLYQLINKNDSKIILKWDKYIWGDPNTEFVWDINWNQSKNIKYLNWYWVYAWPINSVINKIWINSKITKFDQNIIINSLANNKPVIFWYLSKNNSWIINDEKIVWYTTDWKIIDWYVWEHTALIVWVDLDENLNINKLYYFEWKNLKLQVSNFKDISYQASFFDMMIYEE